MASRAACNHTRPRPSNFSKQATHDSGRVACVSALSYFTVVSESVNCSRRNGTDVPIARVH